MYFRAVVTLLATSAFSGLVSSAAVDTDAAAANKWSFIVYQDTKCNTAAGNITESGAGTTGCGPPLEYNFGSVLVTANGGGNCVVGFYTGAGANGKCKGLVAKTPTTIKVGTCYTFTSGDPETYGVTCS